MAGAFFMISSFIPVWAQEEEVEDEFDEMMEMEEEMLMLDIDVTTSGRTKKKLSHVPENMWVLTGEQIRRSGATNIAELMRLIPGMDVVQATPGQYEVSVRDHADVISKRVLVMVDSRPVYLNLMRFTIWLNIPVVLEEIERIEAVMGPGSVLYGSNALMAVINIITKTPDKSGLTFRVMAGPQINDKPPSIEGREGKQVYFDNVYVSGTATQKWDNFAGRFSASFLRNPTWEDTHYPTVSDDKKPLQPTQSATANGVLTWTASDKMDVTLRAGMNWYDSSYIPMYRSKIENLGYYVDATLVNRDIFMSDDVLESRIFTRGGKLDFGLMVEKYFGEARVKVAESDTTLSLLYQFPMLDQTLTTTVGLEGELLFLSVEELLSEVDNLQFASVYLQEQYQLLDELMITGGVRLNLQFLKGDATSIVIPTAGVVYAPTEEHVIRFNYSRGYMNPAFMEAYSNVYLPNSTVGVISSNIDLRPSKTYSLDLGYQYILKDTLSLKVSLFYTVLEDLVELADNTNPFFEYIIINKQNAEVFGAELGVGYNPTKWMGIRLAYVLSMKKDDILYDLVPSTPYHKAYFSFWLSPHDDWEFNADLYFMSFYSLPDPVVDDATVIINPIEVFNVRIAYAIMPKLKLTLTGYNLLDIDWGDTWREGALDVEHQAPDVDRIGRRIMLGVEASF
jgi:outer membrane receptor for ferrienterochelin and colicin